MVKLRWWRVERAELVAERVRDLADRDAGAERLAHRWQQVLGAGGDTADLRERGVGLLGVPLGPHARRPLQLAPLGVRVDPEQLDLLRVVLDEAVDADDHPLARLDLLVPAERRFLDLALDEALLDRGDRAAELVDPLDQLPRLLLELVGERLDEVAAAERVGGVGGAGLGREDLLRAERDPGGALGRERERLVEPVRVQGLRAAGDRRQGLDRDADDVVLRLLRGEGQPPSARGSGAPSPSGSSRRSDRA